MISRCKYSDIKCKGLIGFLVFVMLIFFMIHQDRKEYNKNLLQKYCDGINSDMTRPYSRHCVTPLSYTHGVFLFEIPNKDIEIYEIIKAPNGTGDGYYYLYGGIKRNNQ